MIGRIRSLRAAGVLGINRRNAAYTLRWNRREFYPRVDDKLQTKALCEAAGVPVPRTLAVARFQHEVRGLPARLESFDSFVLKPVHGAMGKGVLVVLSRDGDRLQRTSGSWFPMDEFLFHASSIVSGLYALGGQPDAALVEERIQVHPAMRSIAVEGVPDVRVLVYRGVPIMGMTRLPTRGSGGRANLHQGAVGAGIDLRSGAIHHAVLAGRGISKHPESGGEILGVVVPQFDELLHVGLLAVDQTGLGYVGADLVLDAVRGPVVLELNARPGLSVQLANAAGLRPRLDAVDRLLREGMPLEERLRLGQRIAGGEAR